MTAKEEENNLGQALSGGDEISQGQRELMLGRKRIYPWEKSSEFGLLVALVPAELVPFSLFHTL